MKIYSVTQNPISTNNKSQVNFTSTIPVKLYGIVPTPQGEKLIKASVDENISSGILNLFKLFKKGKLPTLIPTEELSKIFELPVRHSVNNGKSFIYTGNEAMELEEVGKKFGPVRKQLKLKTKDFLNAKPEEKIELQKEKQELEKELEKLKEDYSKVFYKNNSFEHRLKVSLKDGDAPKPAEIHIMANCKVKKVKKVKKYQIFIKDVSLERAGTEPENLIPNFTLEKPKPKTALVVKRNFKDRYKQTEKTTPHNIQGNLF